MVVAMVPSTRSKNQQPDMKFEFLMSSVSAGSFSNRQSISSNTSLDSPRRKVCSIEQIPTVSTLTVAQKQEVCNNPGPVEVTINF
jgi:hypothetical protein